MDIGYGALGIGHGALGIGHWAWGILNYLSAFSGFAILMLSQGFMYC